MFNDYVFDSVNKRIRKSHTRNPFVLAEDSGVVLLFNSRMKRLKGMYSVVKKNRVIIINENLPERTQKIVCAHELGHDTLHREFAKQGALKEFMLYDMKTRPEYEANIYAADLLLDDAEVYSLAKEGYDMEQIAAILETDINLMGLKIANMNYRGYDFRIGIDPKHNFLAN